MMPLYCLCSSMSVTVILCCMQLCSDAVELCCDTVTADSLSCDTLPVDSLSRDGRSVAAQLKPDVITSVLTPIVPEPQRDISRSSEMIVTNSHVQKYSSASNSAGIHNTVASMAVPSIVMPTPSAAVDTMAVTSRAAKMSFASQQHPKSLDQEFTLLNLDIPNITIHGVSLRFSGRLFLSSSLGQKPWLLHTKI